MAKKGVIFTVPEAARAKAAIEHYERDPRHAKRPIPTRPHKPIADGCPQQNAKVQITVLGNPTGGDFDQTWNVNGTSGTPTFDYDFTAAEVKTEMVATFANISTAELTATGGPFPTSTIELEFTGDLANTNIALPTSNWANLTGGTGMGVISSLSQLGVE